MQLCTFERSGIRRLGVLVDDRHVVDAHLATVASMSSHLTAKRSKEIARALVPPSLMGLLLNGRHGLNALGEGLERLGSAVLDDSEITFAVGDVELVPVHPTEATTPAGEGWQSIPFADEGDGDESFEVRVLHTDGIAYDEECFGIVGAGGALALVSVGTSGVLLTLDEPVGDAVRDALEEAVTELRSARPLHVGDVVRTGVRQQVRPVEIDLTTELLEALLTHKR